jgi:hypothetical protein
MTRRHLLVTFAASLLMLTACSVDFNPRQSGAFSCNSDDDCLSGYECRQNRCISRGQEPPSQCGDQDGDGYGTGNDLSKCQNPGARDCFDSTEQLSCAESGSCPVAGMSCQQGSCQVPQGSNPDPQNISPGQSEVCDGIDNDCDGDVDEPISCGDGGGCPASPFDGTTYICQEETCTLVPNFRTCDRPEAPDDCECPTLTLSCQNGSYDPSISEVPSYCK